jgi:hypothetical protein
MQVNDIVEIDTLDGPAEAVITRLWSKLASDPYVTLKTTKGSQTYVRCASTVREKSHVKKL